MMDHKFSEKGPSQGSENFDAQKLKQIVKLIMYTCQIHGLLITLHIHNW